MQIQDTSSLTKKIRGQNDPSWQVFSDCCQSVLPATIEKPYVELSNHFFDYFYSSLKLMESGYRLDTNVTGMNDLRNSVDELSTSERHVLESFRILFDYYKNEKIFLLRFGKLSKRWLILALKLVVKEKVRKLV